MIFWHFFNNVWYSFIHSWHKWRLMFSMLRNSICQCNCSCCQLIYIPSKNTDIVHGRCAKQRFWKLPYKWMYCPFWPSLGLNLEMFWNWNHIFYNLYCIIHIGFYVFLNLIDSFCYLLLILTYMFYFTQCYLGQASFDWQSNLKCVHPHILMKTDGTHRFEQCSIV